MHLQSSFPPIYCAILPILVTFSLYLSSYTYLVSFHHSCQVIPSSLITLFPPQLLHCFCHTYFAISSILILLFLPYFHTTSFSSTVKRYFGHTYQVFSFTHVTSFRSPLWRCSLRFNKVNFITLITLFHFIPLVKLFLKRIRLLLYTHKFFSPLMMLFPPRLPSCIVHNFYVLSSTCINSSYFLDTYHVTSPYFPRYSRYANQVTSLTLINLFLPQLQRYFCRLIASFPPHLSLDSLHTLDVILSTLITLFLPHFFTLFRSHIWR